MKTKLTLLASAIALSCGTGAFAAPISPQQAMEIAASFETPTTSVHRAPMKAAEMKLAYTASVEGTNCYYIINSPASQGFTVVSADDRLPQILGYTDRGSFDPENIPCNMRWWLDNYKNEIAWYFSHSSAYDASSKPAKAIMPGKKPISPITTTTWNQSAPYNNRCPMDGTTGTRSVTGCVATAMAQVMKVYNWPVNPTGSAGNYNFEGRTYEWDKMLDSYSGNYSEEQANAVALLMRGCGAAVYMSYSSQASGAYSYNVGPAWYDNFGYDASMRYHYRDYYSQNEWNEMVYEELAAGRPIYYSGSSSEGGHAFVCDGYGSNGYFHFNWGWGGYQDGYFRLYALNPSSGGIGSYEGGYNSNQTIYTHLEKRTDNPQIFQSLLVAQAGMSYMKEGDANFFCWKEGNQYGILYNPLGYIEKIDIGIRLTNTTDASKNRDMLYGENVEVPHFNGWQRLQFELPEDLDNGIYQVYLIYRTSGTEQWEVVRAPYGTSQYITAVKNNDGITYSDAKPSADASIIAGYMVASSQDVAANGPSTIKFGLINSSDNIDYSGYINLDICKASTPNVKEVTSHEAVFIPAGTSNEISFVQLLDLQEGDYIFRLSDEQGNLMSDDYPVKLVKTDSLSYGDSPIYVPLAGPGFINAWSAAVPLELVVAKSDPLAASASARLGVYIFKTGDDSNPLGSIDFGEINLTAPAHALSTARINFSQVLATPGYYYWQYVRFIEDNGEKKAQRISQKIPVRVFQGTESYNDIYYNIFRTDRNMGEIVNPGMNQYTGEIIIPDRLGNARTGWLATDAFAFADSLQSVSLPGTINSLCGGQFYGCTSLERLEIRGSEPPALSKYAFPENAIQGIRLSVADGGANIFKRTAGWSDFFFPSWSITVDDGVVIADGLINDPATGKLYAPYYVSPEEQPELVFNIPEGKSVEITYNFYGHEADVLYSNHSWKMPALRGLDGTVRFALTDWHEDTAGIADTATTDEKVDVYNMQGVCIMRNADRNAINKLQPGIYVAGGRKIIVR